MANDREIMRKALCEIFSLNRSRDQLQEIARAALRAAEQAAPEGQCTFPNCDCSMGSAERCQLPVAPEADGELSCGELLRGRDYFIVSMGLWPVFVASLGTTLSAAPPAPASEPSEQAVPEATENEILMAADLKTLLDAAQAWKHCPSTHCERGQECRSPSQCCSLKTVAASLSASPAPPSGGEKA